MGIHVTALLLMLSRILFVANDSLPQSGADLDAYLAIRGLPDNRLSVNFGTSSSAINNTKIFDGSIACSEFRWNGTIDHRYDGFPLGDALQQATGDYLLDAVICSTYTPMVYDTTVDSCFPARLGLICWQWINGNSTRPIGVFPNGRIGCPASDAALFNLANELNTRAGNQAWLNCVTNAVEAERSYNWTKPVLSTAQFVNDALGFTSQYNAAQFAVAQAAHRISVDLNDSGSLDYNATTFVSGSIVPPIDVWAVNAPFGFLTAGAPGAHGYSSNYRVLPGGYSAHWYSAQWYFAMDFIWNGGSAAVTNIAEPFADGIRDPYAIGNYLRTTGNSLAEAMQLLPDMRSCPAFAINSTAPDRVTVIGDPLYRPYAIPLTAERAGSAPFAWL